ncbi:YadA-like C-terminal region [Oligella ureolytica]|uniref:YadA-like family protein n=1 Tax=Oligella ureolytica TaxID=90244 RepID=UPI000E014208|nr:YadA-like family protein [Oligella ureolytica]SUA54058.1 YadA-like C-terminal region [Oligella ureolytica]
MNQGWTLTAGGNDSQVQSGDVVSLSNNDGNIVITHAADSGAVAFDLNENITVNNVNATTVNASTVRAGNTVINNSGVSFVNEAGEPVGPSMRPDGIDAGGYPIANVAPGVRPTDAANMGQLSQAVNTINHRIDRVESRADAGTAAAMAVAGLGQPYRPGQSMVSLGSGLWRGETGYALGISTLSGNGKWLIKGAATSSSRGGVGGSASINYAW